MRVLFACVVAWCGQATADIKLSASTFESFSTAFTFRGDNLKIMEMAAMSRTLDLVKASGTLQFDIKSKKVKVTVQQSADITDRRGTKVTKFNSTISQVVLIDAVNSKIHKYMNESAGMPMGKPTPARTQCQTSAFSSQYTQMASMYLTSARLSSAVMMANAMLNMMPHSTSKGVTSFLKKSGSESVWIIINDTAEVPSELVWSKGDQLAELFFDSWGSSGDLSAPACTPGISELDEEFTEGLLGLTDIVGLLEVHPAISEMLYGPRQDDFGFSTLVTVFCISGISGAALVLAFAKLSARSNYKSSPLLAAV